MTKDKIDILIITCTLDRKFYAFYSLEIIIYSSMMIFYLLYLISRPLDLIPSAFRHLNAFIFVKSRILTFIFIKDPHDGSIYLYSLLDDTPQCQKTIHLKTIYEI